MKRPLAVLLLLCALAGAGAQAGEREQAEAERLIDEINTFAERQAWRGVERSYEELLAMPDVEVPAAVHLTAAQAARSTGDIQGCLDRLLRAQRIERTDELDAWINEINENYGRVELLTVPPRPVELRVGAMPFAPDQRQAVELAIRLLAEEGVFVGMLPVGSYELAGRIFEVTPGVGVQVELSAKELRAERRRKKKTPEE